MLVIFTAVCVSELALFVADTLSAHCSRKTTDCINGASAPFIRQSAKVHQTEAKWIAALVNFINYTRGFPSVLKYLPSRGSGLQQMNFVAC